MTSRRGRPAFVHQEDNNFTINVNAVPYTFSYGVDGRLRPTGVTRSYERNNDYKYAVTRIRERIKGLGID